MFFLNDEKFNFDTNTFKNFDNKHKKNRKKRAKKQKKFENQTKNTKDVEKHVKIKKATCTLIYQNKYPVECWEIFI